VVNRPKGSNRWYFRPPPVAGVRQELIRARDEEHARELKAQHRRDREDGIAGGRPYTVRTWMPVYCATVRRQGTKESTIEGYEQKMQLYLVPHIGDLRFAELTKTRILQWFAEEIIGQDGHLLAFTTRKNCFALLSAALNLAVDEGLLRKNPCDAVKIVRPEDEPEHRGYALTPDEVARLLTVACSHWLYALIYTALATGMREGELIGLRWINVKLQGDSRNPHPHINVVEQWKVVRKIGDWQKTKNRKCRDIDIDPELVEVLTAQWERVQAWRTDPDVTWTTVERNLVFPSQVGTPLSESNLARAYKVLLKRAELPAITFHDLRHTAGSLMLRAGARMTEVSEVLGHSSVKVTQDIYAHAFPETRREAVAGMARLLRRTGGA
jgi:integrase